MISGSCGGGGGGSGITRQDRVRMGYGEVTEDLISSDCEHVNITIPEYEKKVSPVDVCILHALIFTS